MEIFEDTAGALLWICLWGIRDILTLPHPNIVSALILPSPPTPHEAHLNVMQQTLTELTFLHLPHPFFNAVYSPCKYFCVKFDRKKKVYLLYCKYM